MGSVNAPKVLLTPNPVRIADQILKRGVDLIGMMQLELVAIRVRT
jgi:hypothetical protein